MTIEDELKKEIALLTSLNQQLTHQLYAYRAAFMRARDREWVGLTDEEAWKCWDWEDFQGTWKSMESKLKEKNT